MHNGHSKIDKTKILMANCSFNNEGRKYCGMLLFENVIWSYVTYLSAQIQDNSDICHNLKLTNTVKPVKNVHSIIGKTKILIPNGT